MLITHQRGKGVSSFLLTLLFLENDPTKLPEVNYSKIHTRPCITLLASTSTVCLAKFATVISLIIIKTHESYIPRVIQYLIKAWHEKSIQWKVIACSLSYLLLHSNNNRSLDAHNSFVFYFWSSLASVCLGYNKVACPSFICERYAVKK